jgi:ornithine cyclodeaminase
MKAVVGIEEVRLYDIDAEATEKVARNLSESGLRVVSCTNSQDAIEGAHIITTCTADKAYATILTDNMVGAGIHINAIGGDCPGKTELHKDILARANTFVEFEPQTRIEGEIQQMDPDYPVTEFWKVLSGDAQGRRDPRQITLFDSVGFATEDFSALRYVYDKVQGTDFFQQIDILADPDDPRDLFGMLQRSIA